MNHNFKNRIPLVLIFLVLMAGVLLWGYPRASKLLQRYTARVEIASYEQTVQEQDTAELDAMYEAAVRYNEALAAGTADESAYETLLSLTDAMGYIEIPKISVYLPIYHGTSDEVLQKGAGHMETTSLPVGGTSTHAVLPGHTGLPSAKLFTDLDQLETGDYFYIHVLGRTLTYQVDQILVVLPQEVDDIRIVQGEDYVTLLTCTPYGINTHRLLVRGIRAEDEQQAEETADSDPVSEEDTLTSQMSEADSLSAESDWADSTQMYLSAELIMILGIAAVAVFAFAGILLILLFPGKDYRKESAKKDESR